MSLLFRTSSPRLVKGPRREALFKVHSKYLMDIFYTILLKVDLQKLMLKSFILTLYIYVP